MGDLSSRRGQILGTEAANGGGTIVRGHVPQAELHLYATDLNSMTHGRGTFTRRFHGYEQMPPEAAQQGDRGVGEGEEGGTGRSRMNKAIRD